MKTKIISLSVDPKLAANIDEARGDIPRSRFVVRILEETFSAWGKKEKNPEVMGYV